MGCRGCGGNKGGAASVRLYCPICGTRLMGRADSLPRIGGAVLCPKCHKTWQMAEDLRKKSMVEAKKKNNGEKDGDRTEA